jgi:hypothetical protein
MQFALHLITTYMHRETSAQYAHDACNQAAAWSVHVAVQTC